MPRHRLFTGLSRKRLEHDQGVDKAMRGMPERAGQPADDLEAEIPPDRDRALIRADHEVELYRAIALRDRDIDGMAAQRAGDPRPLLCGSVMYPQLATCEPPPFWLALM